MYLGEGPAQHANRRGEERKDAGGGQEAHSVFIPLCASSSDPSSESQIGSAHNV